MKNLIKNNKQMKQLIKKILKEQFDQRTADFVYDKLIKLLPIKNGYFNVEKISGHPFDINVMNLDDITYFANRDLTHYLKSFGLTIEEEIYVMQKFVYGYAFMEGNGPSPGDTIVLEYTDDPYTKLRKGSKGNFIGYDGLGQLKISWENGSNLSLIPEIDKFHIIRKK
jgi:hypothetical protein